MVKRRLTLRAQPMRLARAADVMTPADQANQRVVALSSSVPAVEALRARRRLGYP